ncbi:MAG TPA: IclR family transcriptional regulator [Acidimicrobiales bacterium]|nr:IclR family transcriptional regulator [Acidimicrobiales bacterium]
MERIVTGVGVLDKSVAVLDALSAGPLTLAELAPAAGLPRATAHRLAVALAAHGFVDRDSEGRFVLGPRLAGSDLVTAAAPVVAALRDRTGESSQLYVRRGADRVCVLAAESPHSLRTIVTVGSVLPLARGSAGRVLLERSPKTEWLASVEEREPGVASVSAGVFHHGEIVAAVSVSGPVDRMGRTPGSKHGGAVRDAAREIERALLRR